MPKISKIRFINFTYNDNRHIYDQTFDFYKGEDALLNMQNGGGKTVLVQMMMQPIVPKQKLKDRTFKGYFTHIKAPVYIMIEWVLDGCSKKVMTGIGIKRVVTKSLEDEAENLKVVTFISEYEDDSPFDIQRLELLEEERGIVRLLEFEKVLKHLSNAEKEGAGVWLFRWDLPEDKKEYAGRLAAYQINPLEWKNLMVRINEAEAGLNSFFNDCKTGGSLVKKWFIPTIEEQLNQNGNFVENIRELIKNHAAQLVKNEEMISEREVFETFRKESAALVKKLKEYGDHLAKEENNRQALGSAYLCGQEAIRTLEARKDELAAGIRQLEEQRKGLEYERLSGEYHGIAAELSALQEEIAATEKGIAALRMEMDKLSFDRKLFQGVRLREELADLNAKIARFETELEKESLQQEDIKGILQDIEYSLKEKYKEKLLQLEESMAHGKKQLEGGRANLAGTMARMEKLQRDISGKNDDLIAFRGRIAVFEERARALEISYPDYKGVMGEQLEDRLEAEAKDILQQMEALKEKQGENLEEDHRLEALCGKLFDRNRELAVEKGKKEEQYKLFENEKKGIAKIIKSYELEEDCLFDRERLLTPLRSERERFVKLINDRNLENSILEKRLHLYEDGKAFEFPEDVKRILDDENIFVEYGYEWLRTIQDNKAAKLRLVRGNPFLPYSLIVSKGDLRRIKQLEFRGASSIILPLVEREELERSVNATSVNHVHSIGEMEFLVAFDDRILNKGYLKELMEEISENIRKNIQAIENAQEAVRNIDHSMIKAEGFSFTRLGVERMLSEINDMAEESRKNRLEIAQHTERLAALKRARSEMGEELARLENQRGMLERKRRELMAVYGGLERHQEDLKEKRKSEEDLRFLKAELEEAVKEAETIREGINEITLRNGNLLSALEKTRQEFGKYSHVNIGRLMDEDIEALSAKLGVYASKISGKLQSLKDILEDFRYRRNEKQRELEGIGIPEERYMGLQFSRTGLGEITEKLALAAQEAERCNNHKNGLQLKEAEKKSDLRHVLKNIAERCGYEFPKEKEAIRELDFDREKERIRSGIKVLEKELIQGRQEESRLEKVMFSMEEYAEYGAKVTEVQKVQGDLNEFVQQCIKEFKELAVSASDIRNGLAALYHRLESEFVDRAEVFKSLFDSILGNDRRYQPAHALNALDRVYLQMDRKLEQHAIDMRKIDDMETCIIDNTLSYLRNVYDEMNSIDRNSAIDIDGKRCKMLIINLPPKEEFETHALKEYLKTSIRHCESLHRQGKAMDGLLANEISTYDLFDRLVHINKIEINLIKIEPNRLKKKSWKQVIEENSGGERFVSAFVVFISLLTYMRGESLGGENRDSKVLIMDNPFGPITSEHLLKPLFEISKKYDTQMICLTDLKEHTVFDRFNLIYSLNIEKEVGRDEEYIEIKTIKKDISEEENEILSASMFRIEDKSRFELVN